MRNVLSVSMSVFFIVVTHPQSFLATWIRPSAVVLYWDVPDQDEDVFIRTCHLAHEHADCFIHKEESRNDLGRKLTGSMKTRFECVITETSLAPPESSTRNFTFVGIEDRARFARRYFHPPDILRS